MFRYSIRLQLPALHEFRMTTSRRSIVRRLQSALDFALTCRLAALGPLCLLLLLPAAAKSEEPEEQTEETTASCVVTQRSAEDEDKTVTTCFENIALEKTSFESGVCRWRSDAQAALKIDVSTKYLPKCPTSYTAFCDRLVLGPQMIAPVRIFLYDRSPDVLERAREQCLSGGGNWTEGTGNAH